MVVVMVDFTNEVLQHLTPLSSREELEAAHAFDVLESYLVPAGDELVAKALTWIAVLLSRGCATNTAKSAQPDEESKELVLVETRRQSQLQRRGQQ
jgi:hypothetical protein